MSVMTIESMTTAKDIEMRRIFAAKKGYIVFQSHRNYDSISRVISSIAKAAMMATNCDCDTTTVMPFSILFLKRTELYDIVKKLLEALGITKRKHVMLLVDGDENVALEEMFDNGDASWTLEELSDIRSSISSPEISDDLFLSENSTIVRL